MEKEKNCVDFLSRYVEPHDKKSREVTDKDLDKVIKDAHVMYNLCFTQNGPYPGGYAVAHPQIDNKDPLRFFVTNDKKIIINPSITRHTRHAVDSVEGCLSFPHLMPIRVDRYHKIEVKYQTLNADGKISDFLVDSLSGRNAFIWQHEIDHLDAILIYPVTLGKKIIEEEKKKIDEIKNDNK